MGHHMVSCLVFASEKRPATLAAVICFTCLSCFVEVCVSVRLPLPVCHGSLGAVMQLEPRCFTIAFLLTTYHRNAYMNTHLLFCTVRRRSYMSYAGSVLERAFSLTWRRCRLRLSSLAKHTPQWLHLHSNRVWAAARISENACVQAAFLSSVLAHNSANLRLMATVAPFFESTQPS